MRRRNHKPPCAGWPRVRSRRGGEALTLPSAFEKPATERYERAQMGGARLGPSDPPSGLDSGSCCGWVFDHRRTPFLGPMQPPSPVGPTSSRWLLREDDVLRSGEKDIHAFAESRRGRRRHAHQPADRLAGWPAEAIPDMAGSFSARNRQMNGPAEWRARRILDPGQGKPGRGGRKICLLRRGVLLFPRFSTN